MNQFFSVTLVLLEGFKTTCMIFLLTLAMSLPLGLVVAFGSMSRWAPFRRLKGKRRLALWLKNFRPIALVTRTVVWVIRGTPLMLQLFVVFYVPGILWGFSGFDRFTATIVAFVINYSCYLSEIYRGGIQAIPNGQYEAGQVLGMTKGQIFFKIILLQVVKRILAPMSNEVITLVKDTSLARIIAVADIMFVAGRYVTSDALLWPLFYSGAFYLAFCGVLTLLFQAAERKLQYFAV